MESKPLQLNLTQIIKKRAGKKGKFVPPFLFHALERLIRQNELNEMLSYAHPHKGSAFSSRILDFLNISLKVKGLDNLSHEGKYIFASNHPLGGLDGIALVGVLGSFFGDSNLKVVVNDLLMNVTPLSGVFLPVNKFGKNGAKENARLLNEALESGKQIVMFPAGLVSRLHPSGEIKDLEWQKSFVAKALEYHRDIVPVRFVGFNSLKFYKLARMRKKLGIKVNLEQAMLPGEVCKSRDKQFTIIVGSPIDIDTLSKSGKSPKAIAQEIYNKIYR